MVPQNPGARRAPHPLSKSPRPARTGGNFGAPRSGHNPSAPRSGAGSSSPRGGGHSIGRAPRTRPSPHFVAKINPPAAHHTNTQPGNTVRFIPLGGLEEVGRNCAYFEYQDEIIIVDVGIQFPEEETPGVDFIIPNIASLEAKKKNIKAIIFTHGHYDHIHALPYLLERLGNPPIYTADLTKAFIEKRLQEFPNVPKAKFVVVKPHDRVALSAHFTAEFFPISHTIFDAVGFKLETPAGKLVHFGDFRLDIDRDGTPANLEVFEKLGTENIHTIFLDSTNSRKSGFSLSEKLIEENLEGLFKNAKGRVIVAAFSSILNRIGEIMQIADRLGRRVALNGRSMKDNVAIAEKLGYIKNKKGTMIALEEISKHRDEHILILTTGSQGEENSGLMRVVNGEHPILHLKQTDTVIFSSSVVPGNERSVQTLQDNIARQVDDVHNSQLLDIHASGHCYADDLKLVMRLTKPKFVVPVHGNYFFRKITQNLALEVGIPRERVPVMDNGQVANLAPNTFEVTKETVDTSYVMVDGLGVGDVEEVVLRDRMLLSEEGMFVIIITQDRQTGRVLKNPDIISRGFILLKNNRDFLEEIRKKIRSILERLPTQETDPDFVKNLIRNQIGQFLFQKTKRRPMILPVLIEV